MKTFTKTLLLTLLFVSAVWVKQADAQNSVSGHVRYSDNNELVTNGSVKVYTLSGQLISTHPINNQGEYYVSNLQPIETDIIGFPGIGNEEDFPPTFYPNAQDPLNAVSTLISGTVTNRDIYVERMQGGEYPISSAINGNVTVNNSVLSDAIIYAKKNGSTLGYAVSDSKGNFEITGLPLGDYILVAHKKGLTSVIKNVTVTENGLNASINMERTTGNIAVNPEKFSLSQNYPNPFNPSTKINYTLAKNSNVKLAVYNTNGQVVQSIVNEFQNSGTYDVQFDAKNLATGVYYYKLETESFTQTKKMILVK